jgi:hypothetical protein
LGRQLLKGWLVKYSKVAAAVAGSLIAIGVGTPAFAAGGQAPAFPVPTSVDGGFDQLLAAQPVQRTLEGTHLDSALNTVDSTTDTLPAQAGQLPLLGQVTGAAQGGGLSSLTGGLPSLTGALPGGSLLGGLPLGL